MRAKDSHLDLPSADPCVQAEEGHVAAAKKFFVIFSADLLQLAGR